MLHLGSTYLMVKDMSKSIDFYSKLLSMEPTAKNYDRWAQFDFEDQCIALFNNEYDKRMIEGNIDLDKHYNKAYIEFFKDNKIIYGNNFVLNFWIEDLNKEYERVLNLEIGQVSPIKYVNIAMPYYFFTLQDPDDNLIEITGRYVSK